MTQYQTYFGVAALGGATGLIFSLFYAGAMVAIAMGPFIADRYGRRMPIIVGSIVALCGAIIQASSQSSKRLCYISNCLSSAIPSRAIYPRFWLEFVFCLWSPQHGRDGTSFLARSSWRSAHDWRSGRQYVLIVDGLCMCLVTQPILLALSGMTCPDPSANDSSCPSKFFRLHWPLFHASLFPSHLVG
jgi:dipeptide/tripeptide permease